MERMHDLRMREAQVLGSADTTVESLPRRKQRF
jgi:hypothetical protein